MNVEAHFRNAQKLRQLQRDTPAPLEICLPFGGQDQQIQCTEILNLIPGKRLTAVGFWNQNPVVLKCFFDVSKWKRHTKRELDGHHALTHAQLTTPDLISYGYHEHHKLGFALYDRLTEHKSLLDLWQEAPSREQKKEIMCQAMQAIASLHNAGLNQTNVDLSNFLQYQNKIFIVNCSNVVKSQHKPLPANNSEHNLSQFFARLSVGNDQLIPELLNHYSMLSHVNSSALRSAEEFTRQVHKHRNTRWLRYRQKLAKNNPDIRVEKSQNRVFLAVRDELTEEISEWKSRPDEWFNQSTPLNSDAQITRIHYDRWFVQRYNIESSGGWVLNQFQTSKAFNYWMGAHALKFFGIPAPRPVALNENRLAMLRGKAYYVSEFIDGENAFDYLIGNESHPELILPIIDKMVAVLRDLKTARISHGNLTAHKFLARGKDVWLTGLDTLKIHTSTGAFNNAFRKDLQRFKNSWQRSPTVLEVLEPEIERILAEL